MVYTAESRSSPQPQWNYSPTGGGSPPSTIEHARLYKAMREPERAAAVMSGGSDGEHGCDLRHMEIRKPLRP